MNFFENENEFDDEHNSSHWPDDNLDDDYEEWEEDEDEWDEMDDIEMGFRRYMHFLQEEYSHQEIPIADESFCRAVEHYLMEQNPKITEKNLERFHIKLFNKCSLMLENDNFVVPDKMREPIRLASM